MARINCSVKAIETAWLKGLKVVVICGAVLPGFGSADAFADNVGNETPEVLRVPYAFYNDSFGTAGGYVYGLSGYPERQSSLLGTIMAGTKGSGLLFLAGQDLRLPRKWELNTGRLFFDPIISVGYFNKFDAYIDGNPRYSNQRAGTHDSNENNFVTGSGRDSFLRLRMKYLLPTGDGRSQVIPEYDIRDGLLVSGATGGRSFNPLESGRSFIELRAFYRAQEIDSDAVTTDLRTNGLDLSYFWDNRDFFKNPSTGQALQLKISRDFGVLDSSDSWTVAQAEYDQYFSLGPTKRFRQRVLAFNFWTADSLTWDETSSGEIAHRPPAYTGATLGGLWKMRAYPSQRFNDRAGIYYSAELRLMPDWNPFDEWPAIQKYLGVEWLQFVPFVEAGRVAESWDLGELHRDMKWDVGLGIRAWAQGFVVRADTAVSNEGFGVQMMISHPFQF